MGFNSTKYIYALYIKSNEKYVNDLQKGKKYVERRQNCERNALSKYKSGIYRLHRWLPVQQSSSKFLVRPVDASSSDVVLEVEEVERAWSDVQLDKSGWSYFKMTFH